MSSAKSASENRPARGRFGGLGRGAVRPIAIAGVNLALLLGVFIYATAAGGTMPSLDSESLGLGVLPVSAAMGLMLACRRVDFSLPVVLVLALVLQTKRYLVFGEPIVPVLTTALMAAGLGAASALVTWFGRISSALWTGILGFSLWLLLVLLQVPAAGPGPWPWPWALALVLVVLAGGAAALGGLGLVVPPNLPPIVRAGSRGLPGLVAAWALAAGVCALAALSGAARFSAERLQLAYPQALSAAVLGGGFILRGKWGAAWAVGLAVLGHLVWTLTLQARLPSEAADILIPLLTPLVAVPLYLGIDRLIRTRTGESAPTGLVA